LRRPSGFTGYIAGRHRPLLDTKNRFAIAPIENEDQTHLRDLYNGRNIGSVAVDGNERRRSGWIVVPDIVMYELEMPSQPAGFQI
jgi:hypothetical protein